MLNNDERRAKLCFNKLAIALFLYELIFQEGSSLFYSFGTDIFADPYLDMILAAILAQLAALLILGTESPKLSHQRFRPRSFVWLLLLFYGLQLVASLLTDPLESLLHSQGYALENAANAAAGTEPLTFLMLLYSVLLAPLFEEILFRGLIFNQLRRYGRCFAILITALLFGLMHTNVLQLIAAILLGLLLAWIRETYGLPYAILLHISNNALAILFNNFYGSTIVSIASLLIMLLGLIALLHTLRKHGRAMLSALKAEATLGHVLGLFFTSIGVVIVVIVFLLLATLNLS